MLVRAELVVLRRGEFIRVQLQAQCERHGDRVDITGFSVVGQDLVGDGVPRIRLTGLTHREMAQAFRALGEAVDPTEEPQPARFRPYLVEAESSL